MNSKLFGMKTYLVGAMDRVKDGGIGWRRKLTPLLNELGVIVFDPTNKPTQGVGVEDTIVRQQVESLKKAGMFDLAKQLVRPIRTVDLRMTDLSDFIVGNINLDVHTCGTYEEIFLANRQKKPILLHIEQGKKNTPHWLLGVLPHEHIFSTWDELINYLKNVAYDLDDRTFNRWIFFDMTGPTKQMLEAYNGETTQSFHRL